MLATIKLPFIFLFVRMWGIYALQTALLPSTVYICALTFFLFELASLSCLLCSLYREVKFILLKRTQISTKLSDWPILHTETHKTDIIYMSINDELQFYIVLHHKTRPL